MALYYYKAFSRDGKQIIGQLDAPSESGVKDALVKRGLFPTEIGLVGGGGAGIPWYQRLFAGSVKPKDKILFTKQLAILLKSGIPLLQSLELLMDQFSGPLHSIIVQLKDGVKEGRSLADGLGMYPKTFDKIYIQLVKAGEATGNLEMILQRLTTYLERRGEITREIQSAVRGPLIQLAFVGAVAVGMIVFIVPKMTQTFSARGGSLPGPTQFLVNISNFMTDHYLILAIILGSLVMALKYWASRPRGAYMIDQFKLKIPAFNYFVRISAVVQFSRTLGMLLEGGVRLSEALEIVCNIVENRVLAETLEKAKENIVKEGKITQYLKQTNLFPPMAIYLISTGEESGELALMLQNIASNYEEELSETTESLTAALNPIMMVVMALVVGFIVVAMVLPIVKMNEMVSKK